MRCPGCGNPKRHRRFYVCPACWSQLSPDARTALNLKDAQASQRLHELYRQIFNEIPLGEITVTP